MQIIQYTLIEIVHEFYAQSVITLCTVILNILLIYIIELNKIASHCGNLYEASDKHKLHAVSLNMANSGLIDTKIRGQAIDIMMFL